jgi:spectrin beta
MEVLVNAVHAVLPLQFTGKCGAQNAYLHLLHCYRAWINEMIAKVTAPDLAQDVPGAEALIVRHKEHNAEIDTRTDSFAKFSLTGCKLIAEGHFLAHEIEEKISILKQRKQLLNDTWASRKAIYDKNLDTQVQCSAVGL